jgi:hypothetical protein
MQRHPAMGRQLALMALSAVLSSTVAAAQSPGGPDPANVRLRFGPVWLNPTLSLANAGVDTNVFNDPEDTGPKRDFNVTVTPQSQIWLRMGRTWFSSVIKEDIVWYKKYSSERSGNNSYTLKWTVPLSRISFGVGTAWLGTRERPGFEIDARAARHELNFNATTELQVLSKTFLGVRVDRTKTRFDSTAFFLGTSLRNELSRVVTTEVATARHQLTPLTAFTVEVTKEQDRFEVSPLRNSDSTQVNVGLRFDPFALISGSAQIGFRNFKPADTSLRSYKGSTALLNLSYVLGSTKLSVGGSRDVQYSYDVDAPYFLQTGFTASLAQQIYGPVDVEGRLGRQRLAYRTREGALVEVSNRIDHLRSYGAGLGYHFGRNIRLSFNVDDTRRESQLTNHRYHGLRYGTSVIYGF